MLSVPPFSYAFMAKLEKLDSKFGDKIEALEETRRFNRFYLELAKAYLRENFPEKSLIYYRKALQHYIWK